MQARIMLCTYNNPSELLAVTVTRKFSMSFTSSGALCARVSPTRPTPDWITIIPYLLHTPIILHLKCYLSFFSKWVGSDLMGLSLMTYRFRRMVPLVSRTMRARSQKCTASGSIVFWKIQISLFSIQEEELVLNWLNPGSTNLFFFFIYLNFTNWFRHAFHLWIGKNLTRAFVWF